MTDLIPSTANVRDAYSSESVDSKYANRMFDLWLAKYKAKVIAKTEERIIELLRTRVANWVPNGNDLVDDIESLIKGETE